MNTDHLLLALSWAAYCAVHSALIAVPVTEFFRRVLGPHFRFYRLFFNLFSLGTLVLLISYSHSGQFKTGVVFRWDGYLRFVQWSLVGLAAFLAVAGARHYSMLRFLGIQQVRHSGHQGAMTESGEFDSSGVLGIVRHPWYAAVFLLLWARDMNLAEITVKIILSAYLVVGTILEERKLVQEFGDQYAEYQRRVSMFVPLKWLRKRMHPAIH
jgi:protein-S-isoprenylcysteine O-methyltransferase Ste14